MADIIKKQKESLIQTIKEAEQSEMSRMKRLAQVTTSGEKSALLRRYEKERQHDQERIENLTKDFFVLQGKLNSGDLNQLKEQRSTTSSHGKYDAHQLDGARKNRFVGLETHNDVTFHAAVCEKFDKYDHKFQEKATRPVFDARKEIHKLKLLSDKRALLKQLVCLHVAETGGAGTSRDQAYGYTGPTGSSYSGYARSESGYSRDSDRISHATFATGNSHRASEIGRQNRIRHHIPKLSIPVPDC